MRDTPRWLRKIQALGACEDAIEWAKGYDTYPAMIAACERSDWLEWLLSRFPPAWAEYERVRAPAWAEYERVVASARAEYERVVAPAWAEYKRVSAPAWAKYKRVVTTAGAEYKRVSATAARAACLTIKELTDA